MSVSCPKCQRPLDVTGIQPGAFITCQCGTVVVVPKQGMSRTKRNVLIALGIACLCLILPALILPHFIKFADRPRSHECTDNLKAIFMWLRTSNYPGPGSELTFSQVGFSPERGNHYSYFMGAGPMEDRSGLDPQGVEGARAIGVDTFKFSKSRVYTLADVPRDLALQVGVTGTAPSLDFVAVCVGDNGDPEHPDVWSIAGHSRTIDGEEVDVGEPYHHVSDTTQH